MQIQTLPTPKKFKETALITGAASGIGYELACIFAAKKYDLVLVDRNEFKLLEIAIDFKEKFHILVKTIVKDLSVPAAASEIFTELQQDGIKVSVLVNNAGFGTYGLFNETNLITELEMLQVNLVCLTHLTKLFLKDMVKQGKGKILNVSSAAAFQPGPLMAVYFATKSYVLSFSEAIANELENTGVNVTVLCPGATVSAFHERTGMSNSNLLKSKNMMDAKTVAQMGYDGLIRGQTIVVPGLVNKIFASIVGFFPRSWVIKVVRTMQEDK